MMSALESWACETAPELAHEPITTVIATKAAAALRAIMHHDEASRVPRAPRARREDDRFGVCSAAESHVDPVPALRIAS